MAIEIIEEYPNPEYPVLARRVVLEPQDPSMVDMVFREKEPELISVKDGELVVEDEDNKVSVRAGQGAFIKRARTHRIYSLEGAVYNSIVVDPEFIISRNVRSPMTKKYYDDLLLHRPFNILVMDHVNLRDERSLDRIDAIVEANLLKKPGFELTTLGNLALLWVSMIERYLNPSVQYNGKNVPSREKMRVRELREYIEENFAENMTLSDISSKIHVSSNECCREFKRVVGISPIDYLVKRRVFEAARIIYKNPLAVDSVGELATHVGFNTISYFNKIFKRCMNCTPTEFMNMLKEDEKQAEELYRNLESLFKL